MVVRLDYLHIKWELHVGEEGYHVTFLARLENHPSLPRFEMPLNTGL